MKKSALLLLCMILIIPCISMADNDYSYIRNANTLYSMNINDDGNAFISSQLSIDSLKFDHKYSLADHPSYIYSDIIVIDYYGKAKPVWRIWVNYEAKNSLGITGLSITLPDLDSETGALKSTSTKYTFSGIGGKDHITNHSGYSTETPCIVLGANNMSFWFHLITLLESFGDYEKMISYVFPATLHGAIEDVDFDITNEMNTELWIMAEAAYHLNISALFDTDGTDVTTTEVSK